MCFVFLLRLDLPPLPPPPLSLFLCPSIGCRVCCVGSCIQVSIHVITNDRLASLTRLVKSLQDSHYLGDEVHLSFHVDVDADGEMMEYLMVRE